jgi:MFS family permease
VSRSARAGRSGPGVAALLAILYITFLDNTVVSAILTSIQSELHSGISQLQWVVGAYALTFASLMLVCGSLGDNFGRKRLILIGVTIFAAGSLVSALATSSAVLVLGRALMGVGAASSEPGTLSMIRHLFSDERARARALGAWAAVSGLALATGPVIGGVLVGIWSWRAVFWFNLIFAVGAYVAAARLLPESANDVRKRVDLGGFVTGSLALAAATFATIAGETHGYRASEVIDVYVLAVLAGAAFVGIERTRGAPMVNFAHLKSRSFVATLFVAYASYFSVFSIFFFVALYLEVVASASAYVLALDFVPLLAGMVLASLWAGRWVGRVGARLPMALGCVVAAAGVWLTDQVISPHVGVTELGATMGLAGVGFGVVAVAVTSNGLRALPESESGVAASMVNTARELGAVTGVAVLGSIVNGQLTVALMRRLIAIGVPASFRNEIITALTTGTLGSQAANFGATSSAQVNAIVTKVVNAAYGAFAHGLDLALGISSVLLVVAALVALRTDAVAIGVLEPA